MDGTVLLMSERHGIEIDYCPQCRGIWLDRGELDKILDRVADEPTAASASPAAAPRAVDSRYDDRREVRSDDRRDPRRDDPRYRRKKSPFELLGDLFEG